MHAISGMREQKQDSKRCGKIVSLMPSPFVGVLPWRRVHIGRAISSFRSSLARSRSAPPPRRPSASRFGRSTRRPATGCASSWWMRRRASRSRPRTKAGATKSTRGSSSRSTTTSSRPSRWRAGTPSTSTASSPPRRSTSASTTTPITSRRPTTWARKHSRSSATPCAARAWSRSAASCSPNASESLLWSRAAKACWARRCATATRCASRRNTSATSRTSKCPARC